MFCDYVRMPVGDEEVKLSSSGGRILTGIVFVVCAGSEIAYVASGQVARAAGLAPIFAFVTVAAWLLFWAPTILFRSSGITVNNPLRTYVIPWTALQRTESRWALTLITSGRKITVWAAPRQRRGVTGIGVRRDLYGLPDYRAEQVFESQSKPGTAADLAERLITRRLTSLSDENPKLMETGVVSASWHFVPVVVLLLLLIASVISLSV